MRKVDKLREIYAELRAAGLEAPASDLIKLASIILHAYGSDDYEIDAFGVPREGRSLIRMPLDQAMGDGGWRVLEFEARRGRCIDDIEVEELAALRQTARKVFGPQWHYQQRPDSI